MYQISTRICSKHFSSDSFSITLQHKVLKYTPRTLQNLKVVAMPTECLTTTTITNSNLMEKTKKLKEISAEKHD